MYFMVIILILLNFTSVVVKSSVTKNNDYSLAVDSASLTTTGLKLRWKRAKRWILMLPGVAKEEQLDVQLDVLPPATLLSPFIMDIQLDSHHSGKFDFYVHRCWVSSSADVNNLTDYQPLIEKGCSVGPIELVKTPPLQIGLMRRYMVRPLQMAPSSGRYHFHCQVYPATPGNSQFNGQLLPCSEMTLEPPTSTSAVSASTRVDGISVETMIALYSCCVVFVAIGVLVHCRTLR